ncbi:arginine deiminase family protein [Oxyplasma meridianum]|uniref:Arginine deiminase family protein n=1 Tax=Oxyplasma meridianum TaxID=3073602 RepID=A0AAX4NFB6_9ARCH
MKIRSEWDTLKEVMMHRPGIEIEYAMLSPRPFLFERPFRTSVAIKEHMNLQETLEKNGVKVRILKEEVVSKADENRAFRKALEDKIVNMVSFYGSVESSRAAKEQLKKNVSMFDSSTLFYTLTLEPSIDLKKENGNSVEYPTIYSNIPLANLYFMRDQQAVSSGGVIIGNMKRRQRIKEPDITEFIFRNAFGEDNLVRISGKGLFEGGDFIPAGTFCIIGVGTRTNMEGAMQAMNSGLVNFDEVCLVENPVYDFLEEDRDPMVNMHLDTFFNIAADGVAVTSVELCRKAKAIIFGKSGNEYVKTIETTLFEYLKGKNFNFVNLSIAEQMSYSSNFLTLKNGTIVAVNAPIVLKKLLNLGVFPDNLQTAIKQELTSVEEKNLFPFSKQVKENGIEIIVVNLSELTGGYGGAHCMTAALKR